MPMRRSRRGLPREHRRFSSALAAYPVESPADTLAMISAACAQLGERALVCAGGTDFSDVPHFDHVKVVGTVNYAAIFPACRAVVHHGGAGTTAAGLRAGVPTLILWTLPDQPIWGAQLKRLKVGTARRFSTTTREIAGRRPAHHPRPAIPHPGPRDRHPDDQTRRKRCGRRRSCGKFRPLAACWLIGDHHGIEVYVAIGRQPFQHRDLGELRNMLSKKV